MPIHKGSCHCGAIRVEFHSERAPHEQMIGACQCSFCRKHNARALSDRHASVALIADEPQYLQRYSFGLGTAEQVICSRCGVYMAMVLSAPENCFSVINVDALDDRVLFDREPEPRDYSAEGRSERIARRKARWTPTKLVGWPQTGIA